MPLVNRTFDQLIDFTRTSAATFVNSSGNIASTPQSRNLLTFTQEFDNAAWTKSGATITANSTAAPDGTSTADTFNATGGSAATFSQSMGSSSSGTYTASIYAKAGTKSVLQFSGNSFSWGSDRRANFDLANGVLGTVDAGFTATITAVGNGWYRCTVTGSKAATAGTAIFCAVDSTTAAREATATAGTIFIWGAQGEFASAATDYTRNFGGLFPPRFDYDPVTLAPRGLLIEEQRTNLLLYSEQFDNAAWVKADSTVTANSTTSPDGTVDADSVIENTAAAIHRINQAMTVTNGVACAVSVYARAIGSRRLYINFITCAGAGALFDLTGNGAVVNVAGTAANRAATIQAAGNGWYRCTLIGTGTGTAGAVFFQINRDSSSTATDDSYTGDGTSGLILWGSQIEAGAFATSYIPTVASQVTRSADVAAINAPNFASWYNQASGSFVVEATGYVVDTNTRSILSAYASGATSNNILFINAVQRQFQINNSGNQADIDGGTPASGVVTKAAGAYAANDFALSLGGAAVVTDTSGTIPTVDTLAIGASSLGTTQLNGWVRSIRYYPTRLSNAQLQALSA